MIIRVLRQKQFRDDKKLVLAYGLRRYSLVPGKAMVDINPVSLRPQPLRWLPPVGLPSQLNYSRNRRHEELCFLGANRFGQVNTEDSPSRCWTPPCVFAVLCAYTV